MFHQSLRVQVKLEFRKSRSILLHFQKIDFNKRQKFSVIDFDLRLLQKDGILFVRERGISEGVVF